MIEKTILDYLNQELSVPVYMERPEDPPERFVLLEKTGSSKRNYICNATFAIQSYAPSMYEAALLNELVKDTVENAITLSEICRVSLDSDYTITDTAMTPSRRQRPSSS